jgi:hypothetical protein
MKRLGPALLLALSSTAAALAATPPTLVNYQAVLRDASGNPLSGLFDVAFAFYDAPTGGTQILVDTHRQFFTFKPVTVTNGLLNAWLGGGAVTDGSGPGTYTTMDQVFRDYGTVWMEIQIGPANTARDTLAPRVRIASSGYALESGLLGGNAAGSFVDTTASTELKSGALVVQGGVTGNSASAFGVFGNGGTAGGAFQPLTGSSFAYAGYAGAGHYGLRAQGADAGGLFRDADNLGTAYLGQGDWGMQGSGAVGGVFSTIARTGYVELASGHQGLFAAGNNGAAELDNFATGSYSTMATQFGISAAGVYCSPFCGAGAHFTVQPYSGRAWGAYGDIGLYADGAGAGAEFANPFSAGHAQAAAGAFGMVGTGHQSGEGSGAAGYFQDPTYGGTAVLASGAYGVWGSSPGTGGQFASRVSNLNVSAITAWGNVGLEGDTVDVTNATTPGYFVLGTPGGSSIVYASVATYWSDGPYTIRGDGAKAFVQNDPSDARRQVVYLALEGDEAGTYTRGTARLAGGAARVALDPSFARVTDPDVGLTALVTPRGGGPLAIASLTSDTLSVKAGTAGPDDAVFDYAVYGLRLGFERLPIVQPKDRDSRLPAEAAGAPVPGSALARFVAMRTAIGETSPPDLSRARRLRDEVRGATAGPANQDGPAIAGAPVSAQARPAAPIVGAVPDALREAVPGLGPPIPAAAPLLAGDVAAFAPPADASGPSAAAGPGAPVASLVRAAGAAGEIVAGIVGDDAGGARPGGVSLALGGALVLCNADASFGAIAVGDLLTASTTPGRARRAAEGERGAIVAKALQPLAEGTGRIRVLVMSR